MITISIYALVGSFAENKDLACDIRTKNLEPSLAKGEEVVIDFAGVEGVTQSFIHALISEPFRIYGNRVLEKLRFKDCNPVVQKVITIVTEYMQEAE